MDIKLVILVLCSFVLASAQDTDDVTDPPQTTTPKPTTTTTTPTTSTTSTTTTTAPPTTTTPPPTADFYYVLAKDNKTMCIVLDGDVMFDVDYTIKDNGTNTTSIHLPKPSPEIQVEGECTSAQQYLQITWGPADSLHKVNFTFSLSDDKKSWTIQSVNAEIPIDEHFINATDSGTIIYNGTVAMYPHTVPVNQSFKCIDMQGGNYSAYLDNPDSPYKPEINIDFNDVHVQAYNQIAGTTQFAAEIHCDADKTSDIVPIAVGCALGGLVVVVLLAYIVGRRRLNTLYESV